MFNHIDYEILELIDALTSCIDQYDASIIKGSTPFITKDIYDVAIHERTLLQNKVDSVQQNTVSTSGMWKEYINDNLTRCTL